MTIKHEKVYGAVIRTLCGAEVIKTGETHVKIWGIQGVKSDPIIGQDISDFMDHIQKLAPAVLYFCNLKYSAPAIFDYLLRKGYKATSDKNTTQDNTFTCLVTGTQDVYCIRIPYVKNGKRAYIECRDTMHKIQGDIDELAKKFNLPLNFDKNAWKRGKEYDDQKSTVISELAVLSEIGRKFDEMKLTRLTISSDAVHIYKSMLGKRWRKVFPIVPLYVDDFIRQSYRGGNTIINPDIAGKYLDCPIFVYDRISAYPAVATYKDMPWGIPRYFRGKYKFDPAMPLYIQNIDVDCKIKPGHFPCLTYKEVNLIYLNQYVTDTAGQMLNLTLTSVDLQLLFENYDVYDIKYNEGYKFFASNKLFAMYMIPYFEAKQAHTGGEREIYKALIDALTGKIAEKPNHVCKIPYMTDEGIKYRRHVVDQTQPFYTACTAFICSYQRYALISLINQHRDIFLYSDVDSIHCTAPIDDKYIGNKLGDWKPEYNDVVGARYVGAKMYILKHADGRFTRRLASCPDETKNDIQFTKFIKGLRISAKSDKAKLRLTRVRGGATYIPIDFTLK